ncbi:TPP-dependent pyruvate/acetoin dehydrogenase alpha subunit [Streptomyces turgidiscabies]|uniref:TPP-dependent pyruvate/acetoin dehydrogenase alpha subunit n=1 Tax=Streptomyces turgidiscabies TaxID=85558 RepID=A0ABU0RXM1_9ACTN|nr:TPP-dependent pyruvate/acetoin dehydrogenase alpha subunit [Streptomyces turgidiscabies]
MAIAVGASAALRDDDYVFATYRGPRPIRPRR